MKNRDLQLSLYHLHITVKDIGDIIVGFGNFEPLPPVLFVPILKYIMIRTRAFYDELDNHFMKYSKSDEVRYKKLERIYNYIKDERDKYFPDIKSIRDTSLAHNYRVKVGSDFISIFESPILFTVPKSAPEHSINCHLMDQMLSAIKYLYPEIFNVMGENISTPQENLFSQLIDEKNYNQIINDIDMNTQKIAEE
jgi:hypothetical protein